MIRIIAVKPIFWILLFALILRLWGITYGLPLFLINDETPHVYGALKMIELKTLIPALHQEEFKKVLYYPPLLSYFYLATLSPVIAAHYLFSGLPQIGEYKALLALDPSFIWIAARVWTALIGIADIFVIYLLARRLFQSERAGILAALFLSLSFWHIQLSHNARHWLAAAFLLSLLWYMSLRIWEGTASLKLYVAGGLVAGMASGGVNTAAVVGILPPLFMHALYPVRTPPTPVDGNYGNKPTEVNVPIGRSRSARSNGVYEGVRRLWQRFMAREVLALVGLFLATSFLFFALYPLGITRAEGALSATADITARFSALAGKSLGGWLKFLAEYVRAFWNFETPLFLAALVGLGLFWFRDRGRQWVLAVISYALAFFSLLYLFDDFTSRGVVFILPILSAFAGYAADRLLLLIRSIISPTRRAAFLLLTSYFLLFILSFGWQLITDFRYQWLLTQKDTRLAARDWVLENIPSGAKIVMDAQYLRLPNTQEGAREIQAIDPAALRAADLALLGLPAERRPRPAYGILNLNLVSPEIRKRIAGERKFFREPDFEYLIVEYASSDGIAGDTLDLIRDAKLLERFSGWKAPQPVAYDGSGKINGISIAKLFQLERFGLFVDVYTIPSKPPVPSL